jgi:hypothetical protein
VGAGVYRYLGNLWVHPVRDAAKDHIYVGEKSSEFVLIKDI